jgi:dicarboxylate/amino acid:cation (Na+ or H+) symporter, DAACS family
MTADAGSRRSLWILIGLIVGAILGVAAKWWWPTENLTWSVANVIRPVGNIFLRIIFMVVVPLIFSAIVLGVLELGDPRRLGRVGLRCVAATVLFSAASVVLGLALVNLVKPGERLAPSVREALVQQYAVSAGEKIKQAESAKPLATTLLDLIPQNPLEEAVNAFNPEKANGGMIAVMVFSLFFGVALTMVRTDRAAPIRAVCEGLFDVCLTIIGFAMALAPVCVACLAFALTATTGWELLGSLGLYLFVVLSAMAIHQFGFYAFMLQFFAGRSPREFFRGAREAMVTAFATSSSNATLPVSLRVAEQNLSLPPRISRFVLTVGASANQNGTALYEGVTVLFLAQVFGVDLTLTQQIVVALMCILAGIGTAGVPGGSLPLVVGVLMTIQVPPQSIAIILGIDRFLDMCRSALNVTGDLVIAAVVARGESEEDEDEGGPTPTGEAIYVSDLPAEPA